MVVGNLGATTNAPSSVPTNTATTSGNRLDDRCFSNLSLAISINVITVFCRRTNALSRYFDAKQ